MTIDEDELDRRLRAWSDAPLPPTLAKLTLARARATLKEEGRAGRVARLATGTAVVSAIAIYLGWAVQFLNALAR
jgi:hypothetical protein